MSLKRVLLPIALFSVLVSAAYAGDVKKPTDPVQPLGFGEGEYRVGPEDLLEVFVWKEPELTATVMVRPDGKISLPLISELDVNGKTATQLQQEVREKLHQYLEDPVVTVIVKEVYASAKPMPEDEPIQLTIMAKQPQDPRAQGGWVWVTKDLPDGKEAVFMGNFCITCHANANEKHPYGDGNPNEEFRDYVFFVPGEGK